MFLRFVHTVAWIQTSPLLWVKTFLGYGWTTLSLSVHLLMHSGVSCRGVSLGIPAPSAHRGPPPVPGPGWRGADTQGGFRSLEGGSVPKKGRGPLGDPPESIFPYFPVLHVRSLCFCLHWASLGKEFTPGRSPPTNMPQHLCHFTSSSLVTR